MPLAKRKMSAVWIDDSIQWWLRVCFSHAPLYNILVIYFKGRFLSATTSMDWNFRQTTVEKHKIVLRQRNQFGWLYGVICREKKKTKKTVSPPSRPLSVVWANNDAMLFWNHKTIRKSEQYLKMASLMWFIDLMLDHSMLDYCARTQIRTNGLSCSTAGQVDGRTECMRTKTLSPRVDVESSNGICYDDGRKSSQRNFPLKLSQYLTLFSVRLGWFYWKNASDVRNKCAKWIKTSQNAIRQLQCS